ncbi:hypothetical protein BaRGS_00037707 [Batillaria attramentaria]|uniref:MAM domain-containing protein n=1 Tax=Batillaria attramentaria TaxID=370345 RepID=A0ABD0J836_9CAEN
MNDPNPYDELSSPEDGNNSRDNGVLYDGNGAAGPVPLCDGDGEKDTVSCNFEKGKCHWANCNNCDNSVQWENHSETGNSYIFATLKGSGRGKATLINSAQCPTGDMYYKLEFQYAIDCPDGKCKLSVYINRTDERMVELLWEGSTETILTYVTATDKLLSRDSSFQLMFEAKKLGDGGVNDVRIDNIKYNSTGIIPTPSAATTTTPITTRLTETTTTTTTQTSTALTTSTTPATTPSKITPTTRTSTTLSISTTTSHQQTTTTTDSATMSTAPDKNPELTSEGDFYSNASKKKDSSVGDQGGGIGIGIGVTVSVLVVVGATAAVIILHVRRRQGNDGILRTLPFLHFLKRSGSTTSPHKILDSAVYENQNNVHLGVDPVDNVYAQVKKPKTRDDHIYCNETGAPSTVGLSSETDTSPYTPETSCPEDSKQGNKGRQEAQVHYSTPRNTPAFAASDGTCKRESVYELARMGQPAAVYSTPHKKPTTDSAGTIYANTSLDHKPLQTTQDEYHKLSREPLRLAPAGRRTNHPYDHLEEQRKTDPASQIAASEYSLAKPGGHSGHEPNKHTRRQNYENVKPATTGAPPSAEEDYNCLVFGHGHSADLADRTQVYQTGQDVYNHLQADDEEYNALAFDMNGRGCGTSDGVMYSRLAQHRKT